MRLGWASAAIFSLTLSSVILSGCGSSNHASPGSPTPNPTPGAPSNPGSSSSFSVTSVSPKAGTTQVALNTTVQVTFSSAAASNTVNTADIKLTDPNPVAGSMTYNAANNTATFTPAAPLAANTTYTITVSGVTSSGGTAMSATFTSVFTTASPSSVGGGASPVIQYLATLENDSKNYGQITMDTTGKMTVQLTGAVASVKYTVEFCPSTWVVSQTAAPCFDVGTIASDANGDANTTMNFPQTGQWAGDFDLTSSYQTSSGNTAGYSTDVEGGDSSQQYMATLQPMNTVNNGVLSSRTPQAPLSSGTVTYVNGSVQFVLNGAPADTAFNAVENGLGLGSSSSYQLYNSQGQSDFTTDSNGNLSFSVLTDNMFGDLFEVDTESGSMVGYLGGFSVPK